MIDTILVTLLVLTAVAYLGRRAYRSMTAPKNTKSACASCPSCDSTEPTSR